MAQWHHSMKLALLYHTRMYVVQILIVFDPMCMYTSSVNKYHQILITKASQKIVMLNEIKNENKHQYSDMYAAESLRVQNKKRNVMDHLGCIRAA